MGEELARKLAEEEEAVEERHSPSPTPSPKKRQKEEVGGFLLGFRLADGSVRTVTFNFPPGQTPSLGMDLERTTPIKVKRIVPDSSAARHGVQVGWTIMSVNGEDLENMSGNLAAQKLAEVVRGLASTVPAG